MPLRCKNCGWNNADELAKCEKCNASLQGAIPPTKIVAAPQTVVPDNPNPKPPSTGSNPTKLGKRASGPAWDQNISGSPIPNNPDKNPDAPKNIRQTNRLHDTGGADQGEIILCPNCEYPNASNSKECTKCEEPLIGTKKGQKWQSESPDWDEKKEDRRRKMDRGDATPQRRKAQEGATMHPWSKQKHASFHLLPVPREGEKLNVRLDFVGDDVDLNRANLEPTNMTITSKVQAVVSYRDGDWYLRNESEMETTFVRIDGEFKLEKGDILLLGDRMFEFDC
jgi:hypothetical protein